VRLARIERLRSRIPRFRLVLEGAEPLVVSDEIIARFALSRGDEVSERQRTEIATAQAEFDARRIAVNFISYRPRSVREVARHLQRKGIAPDIAEQAAERLRSAGLINDDAFARMFIRDKLQRRSGGQMVLRQKLIEKGVARAVIDAVLKDLVTDDVQTDVATQLVRARIRRQAGSLKRLDPNMRRKKLFDFLMRKGFSSEIVKKALTTAGIG